MYASLALLCLILAELILGDKNTYDIQSPIEYSGNVVHLQRFSK